VSEAVLICCHTGGSSSNTDNHNKASLSSGITSQRILALTCTLEVADKDASATNVSGECAVTPEAAAIAADALISKPAIVVMLLVESTLASAST